MKNGKQKKNSKERRVLVAALLVGAVIVAGSTFAWFTSKDEVTNRLSASANYGVSIAEDFTPPENWLPGQTVDKNVGVVNTGNVDAFVRVWLEGEMRVLNRNNSNLSYSEMVNATPQNETTEPYKSANLSAVKIGDTTYYLKVLNNDKLIQNPNTNTQNATSPDAYSERMTVQAGSELAYVQLNSNKAQYRFTPNQSLVVVDDNGTQHQFAAGTDILVSVDATQLEKIYVDGASILIKDVSVFRTIDSNTFTPITNGLYIFRRNVDLDPSVSTSDEYQFSGYYFKDGVYYALDPKESAESDYVISSSTVSTSDASVKYTVVDSENYKIDSVSPKMYTATLNEFENNTLAWKYIGGSTTITPYTKVDTPTIYKSGDLYYNSLGDFVRGTTSTIDNVSDYTPGTSITYNAPMLLVAKDNIVIDVALSNMGTDPETWTALTGTNKETTFYYNNDLEEGATTSRLVDSLTLDPIVTQKDYLAFDFDLNVFMESVQVSIDDQGNEGFATVTPWAAGSNNVGANGAHAGSVSGKEIAQITWTSQS